MQRRFRWFQLSDSVSIGKIADDVTSRPYDTKAGRGYQIERATRSLVSGRFIERVERVETQTDPFGKTETFKRIDYPCVDFELRNGTAGLQVTNPPRSLAGFIADVVRGVEGVAVKPVAIDVTRWLAALERSIGRVEVREMSVSDAPLSMTTRADLIVTGSGDVRREIAKLPKGGRVASVNLAWYDDGREMLCELSRNGASAPEMQAEEIAGKVAAALRSALAP